MKRLAQLIDLCLEKNIPFVSFSLPGESEIQTWIQNSGRFLMLENFNALSGQEGFVYAPFHRRTNYPVVFFEPEIIVNNEDFDEDLTREISVSKKIYPDDKVLIPVEISKEEYLRQAKHCISMFTAQLTKTVLSRVKLLKRPADFSAGNYFLKLQNTYPNAFCHLINIPGNGTWTGATPEILLQMDWQTARTVALAGTKPKSESGEPVEWQDKEIEEQKIVEDYVARTLKDSGIDHFNQTTTGNKVAGNLVHRITEFEFIAEFVKNNLSQFIEKFHPTPAVCGLPKEQALDLIFQTEKHNREYYSGFCGPINFKDQTNLFVNLRCMKILPEQVALFLGGGLTAKSVPEDEWGETELKTETLRKIL